MILLKGQNTDYESLESSDYYFSTVIFYIQTQYITLRVMYWLYLLTCKFSSIFARPPGNCLLWAWGYQRFSAMTQEVLTPHRADYESKSIKKRSSSICLHIQTAFSETYRHMKVYMHFVHRQKTHYTAQAIQRIAHIWSPWEWVWVFYYTQVGRCRLQGHYRYL